MPFKCTKCDASFSKKNLLLEHQKILNHGITYTCHICHKQFNRNDNLKRHLQKHDDPCMHTCHICGKLFCRQNDLSKHMQQHHPSDDDSQNKTQYGSGTKRQLEEKENEPPTKIRIVENNADKFYTIKTLKDKYIDKFKTTAQTYKIDFKNLEVNDLSDILKTLKLLFQSILRDLTEFMESSDLVRMSIQCPELDFPISIRFTRVSELSPELILSAIENVLQSYEQFVLDESLEIELIHVQLPSGSGRKRCHYVDLTKMLKEKQSIIRIQNRDELCCARALITAQAKTDGHVKWDTIRQGRNIQEELAKELHRKAGVPMKSCGIDEIKQFQNIMKGYQINVLSKEHFNAIIYSGPEADKKLYIYYHDHHYDVITTMSGFLSKSYFCSSCNKGYDHKELHKCNNPCYCCRYIHDTEEGNSIHCIDCNRYFKGKDCYSLHTKIKENGHSTCKLYYRCKDCDQTINRTRHTTEHKCGERYCTTCKDYYSEDHQCYMQTVDVETETSKGKKMDELKFIFFDFECMQDDVLQCEDGYHPDEFKKCKKCKKSWCGSYEHKPNLCVANKVCDACMVREVTKESVCERCGKNEHIFKGNNTTVDFCQWLFSEINYGAKVLCHNFKGYDSYPILSYLYDNAILPNVITTGSKFMSIEVQQCNMRFLDSLNFLPMALAELPKAFGITELAKGFFPHLYNRKEFQTTTLPCLPEMKYYNPGGMKPATRDSFLNWYNTHQNDSFCFPDELLKYCKSDVQILKQSVLKFRSLFIEVTTKDDYPGIDPFKNCITIASACNLVFRRNFLEMESIGIIPAHGYHPEHKQSTKALQWIKYIADNEHISVQHAKNGGEKAIGPYLIDGYYEKDGNKVVMEFHGDFWHGNPKLYARTTINPVTDCTMGDLYEKTMDKRKYLEERGYTYRCIWENDFDQICKEDSQLKEFIRELEIVLPLEPRNSFFGGRTEAFKLHAEATLDQKIKYYDVTSLYPYINKVGKIPLGHPSIITENFKDIDQYEGLVMCKVIPPRGLYIPVLPVKSNGKLIFSLCRSCSEDRLQSTCSHTDNEREFKGTWVTDELKKALEKGYRISKMYEVWHFDEVSQYDLHSKTGGIFTEYINTFLKIKQEASGWPKWCTTVDLKQKYIDEYFEREGILLNVDNIQNNPGLRRLAKLMLNSFWGKFGQRDNLTQSTYVTDPADYFDMLTSDNQEVKNVRYVSDDMVQMDWIHATDFVVASARTNVVIAAYTTAQARLKLYSYLEQLNDRVLYCDTDSIIFTVGQDEYDLPLGDFLGDLTDEVNGQEITTFVTGGPKNYAYKLRTPDKDGHKTCCKVRGITLNYKNSLEINFESIQQLVTGNKDRVLTVTDDYKICRNQTFTKIITKTENKDYKIVFDKRVLTDDNITYPYGM